MSSPATTVSDLVGRSGEQATLRRIGEDLAAGNGGGALLAGPAGIGKSALHEWYLQRAPTEANVLRVEVDPDLPGLGLEELLARLGIRAGHGDTADLRNASADAAALAVTEQVSRRLDELLLSQPVLIGIEDLHWANPTLLVTLRRISRTIRDRPLQLIATLRPDRSNPVLSRTLELLEQSGLTRLELDQLRPDDALELASRLAGARPIGRFRRLIERAGGNPLILRQVVEGLGDGILIRPNGTADLRADPAPEPVRLGWARHLDLLSTEAAELCRTVAVVGANVDVDVLAEVGNETEGALLGPLQEAVDAGILVDSGGQVRFTHELVREAVHDQLTDTVRRARHRRAAQVFDERGDEPARVAYHLSFDLHGDDSEALTRIADAARQMAATDPAAVTRKRRGWRRCGPNLWPGSDGSGRPPTWPAPRSTPPTTPTNGTG